MPFLPIFRDEFVGQPDFVMITADAYVDHPSFGHALISRFIESRGFSVCLIPQPQTDEDYKRFDKPKYAFLISGGVVDSMVAHYTVAKKRRDRDEYSEGGKVGKRPDRAVSVYSKTLKRLYPDVPVIIGGIEASLRRTAHYDYWSDRVEPSILIPSKADLLIYGMGEKPWSEILALIKKNVPVTSIKTIRGTCYLANGVDNRINNLLEEGKAKYLPSYEEVASSKKTYAKSFKEESRNLDPFSAKTLLQKHGDLLVVQNPPQYPLETEEHDALYDFPYMRDYHPSYKEGVPALKEVKFSLASVRGCFGGCSYCAITYHQSKHVQARSKESLVKEAKTLIADKDFKGYIHDVGGPSANIRKPSCPKQAKAGSCVDKNCLGFTPCKNLVAEEDEYLDLLRTLRKLDGVKKVFIRSGIRYDYLLMAGNKEFFREMVKYHISGQLKVAPEHNSNKVLKLMNKQPFEVFLEFKKEYERINEELGKKQYVIPYLISSHPGCTTADAIRLAEYLKSIKYVPEQVQDFYPTPSTKSTCMYYTGLNPDDFSEVYVPKSKEEKQIQRALLQFNRPENYDLVKKALIENGRRDLIGGGERCLIPDHAPNKPQKAGSGKGVSSTRESGKGKPANATPTNKSTANKPSPVIYGKKRKK